MLTRFLTLRFLTYFLRKKPKLIYCQQRTLLLPTGENLMADCYQAKSKSLGTIVFVHGMHFAGKDEANAVLLARCLASTGFTVIVPHYTRIASYDLAPDNAVTINHSLRALLEQVESAAEGISIFATSFAAIHSLYAAAMPNVLTKINTLLLLGTPFRYQTCIPAILANPVKNVAHLIVAMNLCDDPQQHQILLQQIKQWQGNAEQITELKNFEIAPAQLLAFDHALEAVSQLTNLKASVCCIHGQTDVVIPSSESVTLAKQLQAHNISHFLTINPLITHVKQQFSWRYLFAGQQLLQAFDFFFADAQNRPHEKETPLTHQ